MDPWYIWSTWFARPRGAWEKSLQRGSRGAQPIICVRLPSVFSGTQRSKAKVLVMPYVNVPTLGLGRAFPLLGGKGAAGFIWMVGG